ncbi:hypothetical protein K438DRAFT_1770512 [Mycena galopus ATCC 62051]|nr:hypothetical protein K438DRAFT_1770512 [Mycena galopus ATCC 62051]
MSHFYQIASRDILCLIAFAAGAGAQKFISRTVSPTEEINMMRMDFLIYTASRARRAAVPRTLLQLGKGGYGKTPGPVRVTARQREESGDWGGGTEGEGWETAGRRVEDGHRCGDSNFRDALSQRWGAVDDDDFKWNKEDKVFIQFPFTDSPPEFSTWGTSHLLKPSRRHATAHRRREIQDVPPSPRGNVLLPEVLFSIPYGGLVGMVVPNFNDRRKVFFTQHSSKGSAAPTVGGLYYWTFMFSSPKYRNLRGFFSHKYYRSITVLLKHFYVFLNIALFVVVIIALPVATPKELHNSGSFAVGHFENIHISEEARNAPRAVPFAIMSATILSSVLGWIVNIVLAIYMGNDLDSVIGNPIGQPMATIFFNSVGKNSGTLAIWGFMIVALWMAGMDYGLPLSGWLYSINPRTKTPVHEVVFLAVMTLLLGLLSFAGPLAISTVFTMSIQYIGFVTPTRRDVDGVYIFSDGQKSRRSHEVYHAEAYFRDIDSWAIRFEERFEMLNGNEAASADVDKIHPIDADGELEGPHIYWDPQARAGPLKAAGRSERRRKVGELLRESPEIFRYQLRRVDWSFIAARPEHQEPKGRTTFVVG